MMKKLFLFTILCALILVSKAQVVNLNAAEITKLKTSFDKKRAANGEKGYVAGTLFNPSEASSSIALADYFDTKMLEIYQVQTKNKSKYPNWQFVLNEIKR